MKEIEFSGSLYGNKTVDDIDETIYSTMITLFADHDYQRNHFVEVADVDEEGTELKILITVLDGLRSISGLRIPKVQYVFL